ncbi:SLC25A24 [Symbiodinium necroappetens]|uniref:SLC25A24 protein n=1 Tax=Symbiodinium necroappetens TaxID=1628268 RepID=A0A813AN07_9DINO|nr:SLC25A24 [Symbiodinium necroappetens]
MNAAVRAVATAAGALEPVVEGPAANAYEALVQINAALRSNTQLIMGMRVTDARSFFKAMDKDDSGSLDKTEVARGLKRLGIEASSDLLDQIVAAIDVNNDGVLDMKELVRALKDPREAAPPTASDGSGGPGPDSPGGDDVEATEPPAAARSLSPLREARDAAAPLETSEPTEAAEEAPGPAPESPDAVMMAAPAVDSVPSQSDSKESAQEPASSSSIMPDAAAEAETVQPTSQASSPASPSRKSRVTVQGNDRNERKSVASRTGARPSLSPTQLGSRCGESLQ